MFRSPSKKMVVSFIIISNVAVTTRVYVNKEEADLFIKCIFKPKQSVQFTLRWKNYFQIVKTYGFIDTFIDIIMKCKEKIIPKFFKVQGGQQTVAVFEYF